MWTWVGEEGQVTVSKPISDKTPSLLWAWGLFRCAVGRLPLVWGETQSHRHQLKKLERKSIFVCKTRQKAKIGMS